MSNTDNARWLPALRLSHMTLAATVDFTIAICYYYYFSPVGVAECCDVSLFVYGCVHEHISKTVCLVFTKFLCLLPVAMSGEVLA